MSKDLMKLGKGERKIYMEKKMERFFRMSEEKLKLQINKNLTALFRELNSKQRNRVVNLYASAVCHTTKGTMRVINKISQKAHLF